MVAGGPLRLVVEDAVLVHLRRNVDLTAGKPSLKPVIPSMSRISHEKGQTTRGGPSFLSCLPIGSASLSTRSTTCIVAKATSSAARRHGDEVVLPARSRTGLFAADAAEAPFPFDELDPFA
jgi:hypothetical protein